MTISCSPYLFFDGNTREAMEFYHRIFGGELVLLSFADMHIDQMPPEGIMHAALKTGMFSLFASESMPGDSANWRGGQHQLSIMGEAGDLDTITSWFNQLSEGGTVHEPLTQQTWGDVWGRCTDRFGIDWMVNAPAS